MQMKITSIRRPARVPDILSRLHGFLEAPSTCLEIYVALVHVSFVARLLDPHNKSLLLTLSSGPIQNNRDWVSLLWLRYRP